MKYWLLLLLSLLMASENVLAQSFKATGRVIDENGEPIIGVNVIINGTTKGTSTDVDGKFTLTVPDKTTLLRFSFIGYKTLEVKASTKMKVVLKEDSKMLEGVVVTGMTTVDKRMFTGVSDRIEAEDAKLSGLPDISRSLEGRSAGVSVSNVSGTFGTAPKIRVRGATSIYGNSKPLWVVDGVVMDDVVDVNADDLSSGDAITLISSAISGLSADDIESFQILKDGSATSIYGARAMAGVVVVTTKRGRAGVTDINYTGELSWRLKPSYADFNIMNSQDQMSVYREMEQKGWLNFAESYRASENGVYGKMYQLINTYDRDSGSWAIENSPMGRNQYLQSAEMANTDWFDLLFQNTITQSHAVSVASGTDKARYYVSMSYYTDPGWSKSSKVQRYTANANASFSIFKSLSLDMITNASYRDQKAPGTLSQQVDVVSGEVKRDFDINPYSYALNVSRAMVAYDPKGDLMSYTRNYAPFNIFTELENNYMDINVTNLKFQAELKWKPTTKLQFALLGALKYQYSVQEHHVKDFSNQALAYRAMGDATIRDRNPFLYTNPDIDYALPITVLPKGGFYNKNDYKMLGYDLRITGTYNDVFDEKHAINLFGGMEINSIDRVSSWLKGFGYQYDMGGIPFFDYNAFKQMVEENGQYYGKEKEFGRHVALFATGTYSYDSRYTINGTIRYEGSNKLGKARSARWLPTWNISGAWNVSEEWFMESTQPILSHLTLKASYSLTADRGPGFVTNSRVVINSYTPWRPFSSAKESGLTIDDLENSELTYEKKHEFNIGFESGFVNNRINFGFDYYTRDNHDLIGLIETQGAGGQVLKYANVASMESHGVELTLTTQNIKTKLFDWTTNFIFSKNKNEVTKLYSRSRAIDLITGNGFAREGYPVRGLFSYQFKGLSADGFPQIVNESNEITIGDINFQERENLEHLKYEGPSEPTITGSFGNIFRLGNFRLNVFMTYSFGNVVRLDPVFRNRYSDMDAMPKEFINRWMVPSDEHYTNIPVIASKRQVDQNSNLSYAYNAYNYSDARIAKGDFIRMKEISLSYDFPKKWLEKIYFKSLSMKLQATNLFLIHSDKKLNGQDPEFFRSGGVATPVPKQFTYTLRVGF